MKQLSFGSRSLPQTNLLLLEELPALEEFRVGDAACASVSWLRLSLPQLTSFLVGGNAFTVFTKVTFPLSMPGVISGITMVFIPSVSTFAISKMLGGGTEMLLGDLIEQQYMGGAYNPYLGAAISLVMMVIVVICMVVMNRFGEGEEQAVMM